MTKIYEEEALHGYVTCIEAADDKIAIGYSTGTISIHSLKLEENKLEQLHKFSFHRSAISCIHFFDNGSQMASGSVDTYIVIYDLMADTAMFKLLGHNE